MKIYNIEKCDKSSPFFGRFDCGVVLKMQVALLVLFIAFGCANEQKSPGAQGPVFPKKKESSAVVLPDNRVQFRIEAPDVQNLQIDMGKRYDMVLEDDGVWTLTTEAKNPGLHFYSLVVDGNSFPNPSGKTFYEGNKYATGIEVPEKGIDFYDLKDVPHGTVRTEKYFSEQTGTWRRLLVYTPPGYSDNTDQNYPSLYINHGAGENESAWLGQGKLDLIMDNLLAEGKAKPMVIVMANEYVQDNIGDGYNSESTNAFFDLYRDELKNSIIPFVEERYRVESSPESRAIAGLSMGGGVSFRLGMRNPDMFTWVGVFSTSLFRGENGEIFDAEKQAPGILSNPETYNETLNLLYISSGEQDPSFDYTVRSVKAFRDAGLNLEYNSFTGVHEWKVWRKALYDFAPRLFQ